MRQQGVGRGMLLVSVFSSQAYCFTLYLFFFKYPFWSTLLNRVLRHFTLVNSICIVLEGCPRVKLHCGVAESHLLCERGPPTCNLTLIRCEVSLEPSPSALHCCPPPAPSCRAAGRADSTCHLAPPLDGAEVRRGREFQRILQGPEWEVIQLEVCDFEDLCSQWLFISGTLKAQDLTQAPPLSVSGYRKIQNPPKDEWEMASYSY